MSYLLEMESTSGTVINKINKTKEQKNGAKGIVLCLPYDVLRILFKYLRAMDLSSASIVCSTWLKAANDEKQRRGPVCITEYNAPIASNDNPLSWNLQYDRDEIIRNLRIKPKVAIFLDLFYNQGCPSNMLPLDCQSITLTFHSLDSEDSSFMSTSDTSSEDDASFRFDDLYPAVSFGESHVFAAFLPDIPGVRINTFYVLDEVQHIEVSMKKFQHRITQALKKPKGQRKMSKCVLLLSAVQDQYHVTKVLESLRKCNSEKLCLWGGATIDIMIHNARHGKKGHVCGKYALCAAIVMTGAFDCWSMIMNETHTTEAEIEKKLMELKEKVHLKRHSMGLMFAASTPCRSVDTINETKIKYFNKIFPRTPLLDCFGDVMYGYDTISDTPTFEDNNCWSHLSTVFTIITYG